MAGPNSQNQYTPNAVPLDGGLDFITPKISVLGGTISQCLNFERTDRMGYSRIPGYEKFDSRANSSLSYTNLAYVVHAAETVAADVREPVFLEGDATQRVGYFVSSTGTVTLLAVTDYDVWRSVLTAVNASDTINLETLSGDVLEVSSVRSFEEQQALLGITTADALTTARNEAYKLMVAAVAYPGTASAPIIGLHGYNDQVYAVKDLQTVYFENGQEEVFPGDFLWLDGSASTTQLNVKNVRLLSGTWAGHSAAGILDVIAFDPTVVPTNGLYNVIQPGAVEVPALDVAVAPPGVDMSASYASLWQSENLITPDYAGEAWESIEQGYLVQFEDGTEIGPPALDNRDVGGSVTTPPRPIPAVATSGTTTASSPGGAYTFSVVGAASIPAALNNEAFNQYVHTVISGATVTTAGNIVLGTFSDAATIAADASITVKGVKVEVVGKFYYTDFINPGNRNASITVQPNTSGTLIVGTSPQTLSLPSDYTLPNQEVGYLSFGGEEDLWGLDAATMKSKLDNTFGLTIQPFVSQLGGTYTGTIDIYYVKLTVYATTTITEYFFWDGVDDVTGVFTDVFVTEGDWTTNDAEGVLQVANVTPTLTASRRHISVGDEIRTATSGGGLIVATVKSAGGSVSYNGLATLAQIEAANSRYQFLTANFYADENFEALFGVSGAGRAFTWDGFFFNTIYTQEDASKDKPRHIAFHQFHLALGYKAGSVLLSVTGSPRDFDGIRGASEQAVGDPVVGFARMNGTTLGIFCRESIHGLVGTSPDNFSLGILSPYEGAIEYTVLDVGKPIYCSYRGISLFDQTAAYGDYSGMRLSYPVSPWLSPRLQGTISPVGVVAAASGPVVAIPCRSKNQYRLYFGDGYRLTMTLTGAEQTPQFTIQAEGLFSNTGIAGLFRGYVVPRAETSFVDSKGAEHIMLAPYSPSVQQNTYHVLEYDKSWTFDAHGIPSYIVSNENFLGSPFNYDNVRKLRLHGVSLGYAPISVHIDKNYDLNSDVTYQPRLAVDCSLPSRPMSGMYYDMEPSTSMSNIATRGRSFSMRFMSYNTTTQPATVKDPVYAVVSPPFVMQAMLIQNTENKGDT